jgi:hypothetical protein
MRMSRFLAYLAMMFAITVAVVAMAFSMARVVRAPAVGIQHANDRNKATCDICGT